MKKIGLLLAFCAVMSSVWAIPARKGGIVRVQPDGSEVTVYQHGDEHFHWLTNEDGEWLRQDEDGFFRVIEALNQTEIEARRMASPKRVMHKEVPLNIATRGLIILVNFKDVAFTTPKGELDSALMGVNYTRDYTYKRYNQTYHVTSEGSARQYFYDCSMGQYNPQFDVVGPVTLAQNMVNYGGNNSAGQDKNPEQMVYEACKLVDDSVDFSLYDNDKDGVVDFVYIFYAGYGEADGGGASTIWPHQYYLSQYRYLKLDNVEIDRYACSNELDSYTKHHTGIGTFCHEFSHVLGLPDLYTTDGSTHKTWGEWSILDYGPYSNEGNTPPAYSAYERFFMGWLTPTLIVDSANITLNELNSSNTALLISENDKHNLIGNDPDTTCFYMLENRQQIGWDKYLPGHGLLMTKVTFNHGKWVRNTVNDQANSMGVDLIEADGITPQAGVKNGYLGKPEDLFPAGATEYLAIENHPIEEIVEEDSVIYFKYKGGVELTDVENVFDNEVIIAIYDILGQKQSTTDLIALPRGTYILLTSSGTKKIIR